MYDEDYFRASWMLNLDVDVELPGSNPRLGVFGTISQTLSGERRSAACRQRRGRATVILATLENRPNVCEAAWFHHDTADRAIEFERFRRQFHCHRLAAVGHHL